MEDQSKLVDEGDFGFSDWIEEPSTVTFDKVMKLPWPIDVTNICEVAWTKNEPEFSVEVEGSDWIEELGTVTFDKVMKLPWPIDVANTCEVACTKNEPGVPVGVIKDVVPLRTEVAVLFPKESRNIFKKNKVNKSVQINEQYT